MLLAFDPSICNCGWAVLGAVQSPNGSPGRIDSGTWHPSEARGASDRYDQLADFVRGLASLHHADIAAVEIPSGGQRHSATQLMRYARAVGVIEAAAFLSGCKVARVPVNEWKSSHGKSITGMVAMSIFGLKGDHSHDELDALGIGFYWLTRGQSVRAIRG